MNEEVIGNRELYKHLLPEEANNALAWYRKHERHVNQLMKNDGKAIFHPEPEDARYPSLWKGGSWRWFQLNRMRGNIGGIDIDDLGY